jgi:hypothetical protein
VCRRRRGGLGRRVRVRGGRLLHRGRARPIRIRPRRSGCLSGAESADCHDERPAEDETEQKANGHQG